MIQFADLIAQARLPETVVTLCLRGDLQVQWQQLERKLAEADTRRPSMADPSPAQAIATEMEALRTQMRAAEVPIRLRALPAREWAELRASQPDGLGKGASDDDRKAWRVKWYLWVAGLVSRCAVDPAMSRDQVGQLVDVISAVQWDELSNAAWRLNEERTRIPFSAAASALTAGTEPT